jgi:hypothetical protein
VVRRGVLAALRGLRDVVALPAVLLARMACLRESETWMTDSAEVPAAAQNTDREIWRERPGDYYADSIFVTEGGAIGINCGGHVEVLPVREWQRLAAGPPTTLEARLEHLKALGANWDSYGAPPITPEAVAAALMWLKRVWIWPRSNGGLTLGWDEDGQDVQVAPDGTFETREELGVRGSEPSEAALDAAFQELLTVNATWKECLRSALKIAYRVDRGSSAPPPGELKQRAEAGEAPASLVAALRSAEAQMPR